MCAAAISFARIRRLYFGAADEKGGAVVSGVRLLCVADLPPRSGCLSRARRKCRRPRCSRDFSGPAELRLRTGQPDRPRSCALLAGLGLQPALLPEFVLADIALAAPPRRPAGSQAAARSDICAFVGLPWRASVASFLRNCLALAWTLLRPIGRTPESPVQRVARVPNSAADILRRRGRRVDLAMSGSICGCQNGSPLFSSGSRHEGARVSAPATSGQRRIAGRRMLSCGGGSASGLP